ncbi:MAG: DUF2179 domain-containing protein [Acidobacteria bacterium]|nr:DUF2179 domain-containing protein [Acidobacteriota bacterium]
MQGATMAVFFESTAYTWGLLPVLIFFTRIVDVSLGTLRIIFINRNLRYYASFVGFFEVLIWLLVIREIFQHLENPLCLVAYAAGFAAGNYVGVLIENRISIGRVVVRIITRRNAEELVSFLRSSGYALTVVDGEGATGPVKIIFIIVERKDIQPIVETIHKYNPNAFFSVEDVRFVSGAVTPYRLPAPRRWTHFHSRMRKKV